MKLEPLKDRVVLKQIKVEETTKSGIILPDNTKEKPQEAIVVAVGPGETIDGKLVPMSVKVNDSVIYSKYAGTEVKVDNQKFIVCKESDILAIVKE